MPVEIVGEADLLRLFNLIEQDVKARKGIYKKAAKPVLEQARIEIDNSPRGPLAKSGRIGTTKQAASIRFGSARVPYAGPYAFGHGSASNPRPQGGYMPGDPFHFDAVDKRASDAFDVIGKEIDLILDQRV